MNHHDFLVGAFIHRSGMQDYFHSQCGNTQCHSKVSMIALSNAACNYIASIRNVIFTLVRMLYMNLLIYTEVLKTLLSVMDSWLYM